MATWSDDDDDDQNYRGLLGYFTVDTPQGPQLIASPQAPDTSTTPASPPQNAQPQSGLLGFFNNAFDPASDDRGTATGNAQTWLSPTTLYTNPQSGGFARSTEGSSPQAALPASLGLASDDPPGSFELAEMAEEERSPGLHPLGVEMGGGNGPGAALGGPPPSSFSGDFRNPLQAPDGPPRNPPGRLNDQPVGESGGSGVSYVTPNGQVIQAPQGYRSTPAENGKGLVILPEGQLQEDRRNTIRWAEPNSQNPQGYFRYYNNYGQPLNPATGKPDADELTHIDPSYNGPLIGYPGK